MSPIHYSVEIRSACESVFRLLEDESQAGLWMEGVEQVVFHDDEKQVGSRFVQHVREGRHLHANEGEITAYDPPHRYSIRLGNEVFAMDVDYRIEPSDGGCRLSYDAVMIEGNWLINLLAALFQSSTRRLLERHLINLKQLAEQGRPVTSLVYG